ncbi:MAG: DUF2279 domain-containing protein, partial [Flavobacteriales bacterium]
LSIGYGADGLLGANSNPEFNSQGEPIPEFTRQSQWLLSLDFDLTRIKWKRKGLKNFFGIIGFIKIPAPALILQGNQFTFKPLYF